MLFDPPSPGHHGRLSPRWVYWLLQATCVLVLAMELDNAVAVVERWDEINALPVHSARYVMRPFVACTTLLAAWWLYFRVERDGARVLALAAAAVLAIFALVMWLNVSVNDLHYPSWVMSGYPAAAVAFAAYTCLGRERTT